MDTEDRVYKRTYTSLKIHALRNNGYLAAEELPSLNLPTTPEVLDEVLHDLESDRLMYVLKNERGNIIYDFLPFIEHTVGESMLDMPTRMQVAKIYIARSLWTSAIPELRVTQTHPAFQKESAYLLGRCFEEKLAFDKAQESYERVLAADYFYLDALNRLNTILERRKQQSTVILPASTVVTAQQQLSHALQERYEIVKELGRGGAGIVYQAIDLKLKRDVALKVLYPDAAQQEDRAEKFLHEARLAAQFKHPNIIDVYDVDVESRFIAMEFVDGGTLRDIIAAKKRLPLAHARAVVIQLCEGLQCAHRAGVLHRDIKPENIFITKKKQVKLGDFGIAHIADGGQNALTQLSAQIGTLPYMSPEQVQGEALTPASDLYAVGVVLYEMLTGAPPFLRGDLAYHHMYSAPNAPGISPAIDAIVLRCLAKDAAQRFAAADELRRTLQSQEKEEKERMGKYRELLKMALVDKALTRNELLILKLKRKAFNLTDEEARRVEQELGVTLP